MPFLGADRQAVREGGRASGPTRSECCVRGPDLGRTLRSWAPQARAAGLRGSFVSGSGLQTSVGSPPPPSPPGLSAEWRVAGPLVCGGRREEIEEWF